MTPENQRDEEVKIYYDDEYLTIPEAISKLTPEEIDRGDHCNQTIIDLVSALTSLRQSWEREKKGLEERVRKLENKLLIAQEKTERVRDEWREAKNGFLITDSVKTQELIRLKARNEELEAEAKYLREHTHCSYCDFEAPVDIDSSLISKHIQEDCKNHPYAVLRDEISCLKVENDHLKKMIQINRDGWDKACEEGRRLESENERLKNKDFVVEAVKQVEASDAMYRTQCQIIKQKNDEITRLTASLAVAHEALDKIERIPVCKAVDGKDREPVFEDKTVEEMRREARSALTDPEGAKALERWRKMDNFLKDIKKFIEDEGPCDMGCVGQKIYEKYLKDRIL